LNWPVGVAQAEEVEVVAVEVNVLQREQ